MQSTISCAASMHRRTEYLQYLALGRLVWLCGWSMKMVHNNAKLIATIATARYYRHRLKTQTTTTMQTTTTTIDAATELLRCELCMIAFIVAKTFN